MIAILATALALSAPTAPRIVDRVVAMVNGDPITLRQLQDRAGSEWGSMERLAPGPERDRSRLALLRAAYEAVLDDRLIDAQAKALQVDASDAEVNAVVDNVRRQNGLDDAAFARALASEGLTLADLREQYRRRIKAQRVIAAKYGSRLSVSDDMVKSYYEQHAKDFLSGEEVRVRDIFFAAPAAASEDAVTRARARAERALARLRAGEDFAAVARSTSQGLSAREGGDLGWLKRGVVERSLEKVAFSLKPGEHSGIVRASSGFHILQAEERRGGEVQPLVEVRDRIREQLAREQEDGYTQQLLADLKRDAVIDVRMAELKR
jgi:peptidyl-prolyl cis-trans isomerase SurA